MNISVSGDGVFFFRLQHQHAALPVQHRSLVRISQAQQHMEAVAKDLFRKNTVIPG